MRPSAIVITLAVAGLTVAGCSSGSSGPSAGSTPGSTTPGGTTSSPGASSSSGPGGTGTSTPAPGSSAGPGGSTRPGKGPGAHPHKSTAARTPPPRPTIAVSSGYKRTEKYCAVTPATGTLTYTPSGGSATIRLAIGGLPANTLLAIDWQLNSDKGYSIGSFQTDGSGASEQDTLRMFRSPGRAGIQVQIDRANGDQVAQLNPC